MSDMDAQDAVIDAAIAALSMGPVHHFRDWPRDAVPRG